VEQAVTLQQLALTAVLVAVEDTHQLKQVELVHQDKVLLVEQVMLVIILAQVAVQLLLVLLDQAAMLKVELE
jgi:hypothetical protein